MSGGGLSDEGLSFIVTVFSVGSFIFAAFLLDRESPSPVFTLAHTYFLETSSRNRGFWDLQLSSSSVAKMTDLVVNLDSFPPYW